MDQSQAIKFELGQLVVTPRADQLLREAGHAPEELLARHQAGDWGDVSDEERRLNDESVSAPFNIISTYQLKSGYSVTIFTKADRSATMLHVSPPRTPG